MTIHPTFASILPNTITHTDKGHFVQTMNIDKIKTDNKYLRLNTNVDKLKKSIETVGVINPLVINEDNLLVAGGRRYTALKQLEWTEVPVVVVTKGKLHDELISIDENLVRKDLTKVETEHALRRAKEIYEELYPDEEALTEELPKGSEQEQKVSRFIAETSEKTGLSQKVITNSINRDIKASKKVKKARVDGELSSSQTDELIKLDAKVQDQMLDVLKHRPLKEIKHIIKTAKALGVEKAINEAISKKQLNKEYQKLNDLLKKLSKVSSKILLEEIELEHETRDDILVMVKNNSKSLNDVLELNGVHQVSLNQKDTQEFTASYDQ